MPASVGGAPDPLDFRFLALQRLVNLVGVGLDRALESRQPLSHWLQSPAGIELQDDVPARHGIEPEVAAGRLPLNLRVEHPDRRLVDLQGTRLPASPATWRHTGAGARSQCARPTA